MQNMRVLVPVTFQKGVELKDRWLALIAEAQGDAEAGKQGARLDMCHWVSRATFDVIGLAGVCDRNLVCENGTDIGLGFGYQFNTIHDEFSELFAEMFEIAVSQQGGGLWELAIVYAPILDRFAVSALERLLYHLLTIHLQPGPRYGVVKRCQEVIRRVADRLM